MRSKQHLFSFAIGIGTQNEKKQWLEVFYPNPMLSVDNNFIDSLTTLIPYQGGNKDIELDNTTCHALEELFDDLGAIELAKFMQTIGDSQRPIVATFLQTDDAPITTPEAYLKLHLLSHRLVKPNTINLQGIFSVLPNIAWTNEGAIDLNELKKRQIKAKANGKSLSIRSVDKFPRMSDYIVPNGVRIADTSRVRLGAYLGEGTTVMQEGFINFNAGTEGKNMIEGRVSSGIWIGEGSDLGGGCSTMGTLSGGNQIQVSIGKNCLIGAEAGLNISLGDRCTIEAGLYLTAGSKVALIDKNNKSIKTVKAIDLANKSDLLFWRNSQTGSIECIEKENKYQLNDDLHIYN